VRFAQPELLWSVPAALLALAIAGWLSRRRRRNAAAKFAGGPGRTWADDGADRIRGRLDAVLVVVAAAGLGLAGARPLIFQASTQSELRGVPYILALDLSRSMLTPDVRPNRWTAATNAIAGFLEEAGGDRVGLVTFSGVAYLNAPLSFDTRAIQTILRYTSPLSVDMDGETAGSDLGAAIEKAGRYFVTNSIQPRVVVLVTDGEDSGTALLEVGRRWARQGVKVCAIGVGTRAGAKVPRIQYGGMAGGGSAQNSSGQEVVSRLNEANLKRITALTGGRYHPLGERGEGFRKLREEFLRPLTESAARQDLRNYVEGYQYPLGAAILALLARFAVGAGRSRRAVVATPIRTTETPRP